MPRAAARPSKTDNGLRAIVAAAIALAGGAAAAQTNDPAAPFLGTWSGVFTTSDHEYWQVEDFVCFPGCAPAAREHMRELLADPANDELPVGALLGQAFGFAAEHIASILTPLGKRIQEANELDNDPKLHCEPYGFVRQVTNPLPMIIRRNGEHLVFEYEEWSLLRTVFLDGRAHPVDRTPSLLGHSVGRFEDGALVIETTGVHAGWISDATEAGHSDRLRATERYTVHDDPRRLELELRLEDPLTLTEPYVIVKTWLFTPDVELVQDRCGDLPGQF